MFKRYLLASFVGGLIGACCVLIAVYVTNAKALSIDDSGLDSSINALHSRINDFYIFAGIVITLLLAINVGVFVRADEEVDRQIEETFGKQEMKLLPLLNLIKTRWKISKIKSTKMMKRPDRKYILNRRFISILRHKVTFNEASVSDFEIIEDLLEAFGKPRDLVLRLCYQRGIYSYEEFLTRLKQPHDIVLYQPLAEIAGSTITYLDGMVRYFAKKEDLRPETWELKNPENV